MCQRHAVADAIVAAQAAANLTSQWVTFSTYGSGANPMIAPGGAILAAVQFPNTSRGGFKFVNIDVSNAQAAGFDFESANGAAASGLRIEGGTISNITGMHVTASSIDTVYNASGLNVFAGTAVNVWRANYVSVDGTTITNGCDMALYIQGCADALALNVNADHTTREGSWLSYIAPHAYPVGPQSTTVASARNLVQGGSVSYTGFGQGIWWGTAGVQFNGGTDMIVRGTEVSHTTGTLGTTPDQVCFDQEGYGSVRTAFLDCNGHDNNGAFLLLDGSGVGSVGTMVAGSTSNANGALSSGVTYPTFLRVFHAATLGDNVIVLSNTITRYLPAPSQKVNDIEDTGADPQGKQDAYPARFVTGGNTVTN